MSFHELKKYFQTLPPPQHIDCFDLTFQGGCHLTCGTFNETSKGQIKHVAQSSQKECTAGAQRCILHQTTEEHSMLTAVSIDGI